MRLLVICFLLWISWCVQMGIYQELKEIRISLEQNKDE